MNKATLSFEFFPPKTLEGKAKLYESAKILAEAKPEFFSVTFGAGGSTREGTLEAVETLQQITGIPTAPHISCIGSSCEELSMLLEKYIALNIKRIVALRGDLPSGMGQANGELRYANELVAFIRKKTGAHFHIEVAAYPEFHPQAKNAFDDLTNFQKKVDAGATSALTQYFFNPDSYFYFVDACNKLGITIPIVPGIMPIMNFSKLVRFSDACGAEIPRWIRKRLEAYGDDHSAITQFGTEVVYDLCLTLLEGGAPGLHFYTLNQAEPSCGIWEMLQDGMPVGEHFRIRS